MSIGEKIKAARKKADMTQQELATKCNISRSYLGNIELNKYNPSVDTLRRIAESLDVQTSALLDDQASILEITAADNGYSDAFDLIQRTKQARPDEVDELDGVSSALIELLTRLSAQEEKQVAAYIQGLLSKRED